MLVGAGRGWSVAVAGASEAPSFDITPVPSYLAQRVFFGGVSEEIRVLVWPFLLGLFPWQSTAAERRHIRTIKECVTPFLQGRRELG